MMRLRVRGAAGGEGGCSTVRVHILSQSCYSLQYVLAYRLVWFDLK